MGDYSVDATFYSAQSGVRGTVKMWVSGPDKYRVDADYGKYGKSCTVVNGDRAWVESSFGPFRELHGKYLWQAQMGHPYVMSVDWREYYDTVEVVGTNIIGSTEVYVVELKYGSLPKTTVYVDTVTGDVILSESVSISEGDVQIAVTTKSEDFREVNGVRSAARAISVNDQSGRSIVEEGEIETNLELDDSFFVLTPPVD
jgi:outer membrane lipoprotein-sorting protein